MIDVIIKVSPDRILAEYTALSETNHLIKSYEEEMLSIMNSLNDELNENELYQIYEELTPIFNKLTTFHDYIEDHLDDLHIISHIYSDGIEPFPRRETPGRVLYPSHEYYIELPGDIIV